MPALSQLQIANLALARLPAKEIAAVEEISLEAREVRRFYPQAISAMLEGEHAFSFANQRALLASVTNDRPAEWLYAYALPSNLGNPIRVIPDFNAIGIAVPIPLDGEPYREAWVAELERLAMPYEIEGQTLYTNAGNATLEYSINDVAGLNVSQLFIKALWLALAAELAMPLKQSPELRQTILSEAEIAYQRAIADDRNRQPDSYGNYTPENIAVRHGIC